MTARTPLALVCVAHLALIAAHSFTLNGTASWQATNTFDKHAQYTYMRQVNNAEQDDTGKCPLFPPTWCNFGDTCQTSLFTPAAITAPLIQQAPAADAGTINASAGGAMFGDNGGGIRLGGGVSGNKPNVNQALRGIRLRTHEQAYPRDDDDYNAGVQGNDTAPKPHCLPFGLWRIAYQRSYVSEEEEVYRTKVYAANCIVISQHNADSSQTWTMAPNRFTDMTPKEFEAAMTTGLLPSARRGAQAGVPAAAAAATAPMARAANTRIRVDITVVTDPDNAFPHSHPEPDRTALRSRTPARSRSLSRSVTRSVTGTSSGSKTGTISKSLSWSPTGTRSFSATRTPTITVSSSRTASSSPRFSASAAANSVDWVLAGAVTPVKNQGSCGSCYTFSAIGALEGARVIFGKQPLTRLSEQQMLECTSGAGGNYGCNGGLMDNVFRYMMTRPTCLDNAYPYTGVPKTCRDSTCGGMPATVLRGYVDVQPMSDDALAGAVRRAPTSVAVQADQPVFQFYSSGVVTSSCGASVDHAVLAVGFGTSSTAGPYWKIKNSWGAAWGEGGYIRIARGGAYNGGAGQCGVYTMPSYPVLAT